MKSEMPSESRYGRSIMPKRDNYRIELMMKAVYQIKQAYSRAPTGQSRTASQRLLHLSGSR